ncbi:MAG: DUF2577 family protein [Bacillota bacterium]
MTIKSGIQPEGNAASQLVQLMRKHGYNKDVEIELGTITGAPPALKLKVDNMPIELDADDLVVAEQLTKHKRRVKVTGLPTTVLTMNEYSRTTQKTSSSSPTTDSTYRDKLDVGSGTFGVSEIEIEYLDELQVGERVIVASTDEGQTYLILDRAVIY